MKNDNLAIIIPAYKAEYLEQTLKSIAGQSDKRFKVYIGDDCSPYRLKNIIEKLQKQLILCQEPKKLYLYLKKKEIH